MNVWAGTELVVPEDVDSKERGIVKEESSVAEEAAITKEGSVIVNDVVRIREGVFELEVVPAADPGRKVDNEE